MYINGQQVGTIGGDLSPGGQIYNNDDPLTVGSNSANQFYFNGKLDDLRIYDRALSEIEVQKLFHR